MAHQSKGYKKFVATAATATLVASAIAPVVSAASFKDVSKDYQAAVDYLVENGIAKGTTETTFGTNLNITRGDAAVMIANAVNLDTTNAPSAGFTDVNTRVAGAVNAIVAAGIANGKTETKFDPSANITRAEMAKMLANAFGLTAKENAGFKDVNKNWIGYVSALKENGITLGKTETTFAPDANLTRGEFALFMFRAKDINPVTDDAALIKAINNTTVEVTFEEAVEDLASLNFSIQGLDITQKVIKQTNAKTVVLTTAPQEAGKLYTVTANDKVLGTFAGVSAVIPTNISLVKSSTQGKLGQEVTVQAQVTVKDGDSKAGIPVTFYVPGNNDAVYPTLTGEATTNADGIATYTYTRYAAGTDSVTAYATGDRSKFSNGFVFWGVDTILTVEEVTEGATINNGANKTYKVTYKNPTSGKVEANKTLNVSVLENIGVTADKLQNVTVNGVEVAQLSNNTRTLAAQITTDSKGEATFTVSGTNAEATPVVFEANNTRTNGVTNYDYTYQASDLQATAAKVKFAAIQAEYTIEMTRDGGEVAATGEKNGRVYKIVVKDKDGKVAKNETVNVAFNEELDRVISTNTKAKFVNPSTESYYPTTGTGNTAKQISVKTNDKGEASFVIATDAGNENDYATPIAWIDINTSNAKQGKLDEGEPQTIGQITHFQAPYLDGAKLIAQKNGSGDPTSNFDAADKAVFRAQLVNQSNKVFTAGYSIEKVTYTVFNTGAEDVIVNNVTISPNRSESFTESGSLTVESVGQKSTSVRVVATGTAKKDGKDFIFTAKEATATFTSKTAVADEYTGNVVAANKSLLQFAGKDPISLKDGRFFGSNGSELFGVDEFLKELSDVAAISGGVVVTYIVDKDGNTTFKVVRSTSAGDSYNVRPTATAKQLVAASAAVNTATPATATINISAVPSIKVNDKVFTYDVNATIDDSTRYASPADLVSKINASGTVQASVSGSTLTLTGSANGDSFWYQVGNLAEQEATNGQKITAAVNQELEFTFTEAIKLQLGTDFYNVAAGQTVALTGSNGAKTGTVKAVQGNKVVVEVSGNVAGEVTGNITALSIDGKTIVGRISENTAVTNITVTY